MKYLSLFSGIGGFELGIQNAYENIKRGKHLQKQRSGRANSESVRNKPFFNPCQKGWKGDDADCVGFSEIDKYANQVLKYHFPNIKNYGDITKIITAELPDFNLLVGGFPCQSFSIAGKRGGFKDTRGTLFFEIARILKDKRPAYLLLENVKGLLNHDKGNTFATIISTLDELGYDCQWSVLNSKNFGVPQNRERVFIVGHLRGQPRPKVFPIGEADEKFDDSTKRAKEVSSTRHNLQSQNRQTNDSSGNSRKHSSSFENKDLKYVGAIMSEKNKRWLENGKELSRNFPQGQRVYSSKGIATSIASQAGGLGAKTGLYMVNLHQKRTGEYGDGIKQLSEPSFTLDSGSEHDLCITNNSRIRRLTPTECERLQAFPNNWTKFGINEKGEKIEISDSQRYKMCGNALTTNVVAEIIKRITLPNNQLKY